MKLNLIRTCDGNIINLDNVFFIDFNEEYNETYAHIDASGENWVKVADGNALILLWNGRRDFYEGGEC